MTHEETLVAQLESELADQPVSPLRPNQVHDYEEERERLERMRREPQFVGVNQGLVLDQLDRIRKDLDRQRPKPLEGPGRVDRVAQRIKQVTEAVIKPAMLPRSVMRRNPAGAVDAYFRREGSPFYKRAALAVKRGLLALAHDNTDPGVSVANLEPLRPEGTPEGTSTFMADAQIPGVFAMSPLARLHWPLGEPTADTALKQAQRGAQAELGEPAQLHAPLSQVGPIPPVPAPSKPTRRGLYQKQMTEEARRTWKAKMLAAKQRKRAERQAASESA